MANIVVTSDAQRVYVFFNDFASDPNVNTIKSIYPHGRISLVSKPYTGTYILLHIANGTHKEEWCLSNVPVPGSPEIFPIDTINGTTPTDLDHLYDLLGALIL